MHQDVRTRFMRQVLYRIVGARIDEERERYLREPREGEIERTGMNPGR